MRFGGPSASGARPVADAPAAELSAAAGELTKAWLLSRLEAAPLEALPAEIPPELASHGPRLVTLVARALTSNPDLEQLVSDPLAARAGRLVGARDLEDVLRAIEALRRVVWAAVREARPRAAGDEVAQLAERLATVIEAVRAAAVGDGDEPAFAPAAEPEPPVAREPEPPVARQQPPVARQPEPPVAPEPVIFRIEPEPPPAPVPPPPREPVTRREPPPVADDPGAALWQRALADEVAVAIEAGTPLSLLRIELADAGRLVAAAPAEEVAGVVGRFTQAIRSVTRRQDILARESDAHMWVIARDTGRVGAEALGRRAVASVGAVGPWRDAPLQAAVGVAVLGEDAGTATELIAAAEAASFVAAASGSGVERPPPNIQL